MGGESHLRAAAGVVEVGEIRASERGGEEMEATLGCVCTCSWAARDLLSLSRALSHRSCPPYLLRPSVSELGLLAVVEAHRIVTAAPILVALPGRLP